MKVKTIVKVTPKVTPMVGECYRHPNYDAVFMRITDYEGRKALDLSETKYPTKTTIFCIDLKTGKIKYTLLDKDTIILVKPVKGTVEFEEV